MKMFKKLAAVALAAVLALSMVGCGAGGTGSGFNTKDEVVNTITDLYYASDKTANHDKDLDTLAGDLITAAAAVDGEGSVEQKLTTAAQNEKFVGYTYVAIPDAQLKTAAAQSMYVQQVVNEVMYQTNHADEINFGVATGKIGNKTYLVVMTKVVTPSSH